MIVSFSHKGLELFFLTGSRKGIQAVHAGKLRLQLAAIDSALVVGDLDLPGFRLHELKGDRKGYWSISVSGNWRLTFRFHEGNAEVVNYEDYH